MRRLAEKKRVVEVWRRLEKRISDAAELKSLAEIDGDAQLEAEVQSEINKIALSLDELELELAFSG